MWHIAKMGTPANHLEILENGGAERATAARRAADKKAIPQPLRNFGKMVELSGIEPLTSALRTPRSPN